MKYVINATYGGFKVPAEVCEALNCDRWADNDEVRTSKELIEWVKNHSYEDLAIVEIPDNATDWELDEYDGWESIIAVIDGKIVHLETLDIEEKD